MKSLRAFTFNQWAPPGSKWSAWAKPVLFAHLRTGNADIAPSVFIQIELPFADGHTAIVVDLPALESVRFGLSLATRGYRPVPLFNALPGPQPSIGALRSTPAAAVDLWPAASALEVGALELVKLVIPAEAPPAFLLDADRRGSRNVGAGDFDNRSVSLTTDFPSAAIFGGAGINTVILIAAKPLAAEDLAHTLRRWQSSGIKMLSCDATHTRYATTPLEVRRPTGFRMMFQRLLAVLGLKANPFGGFGATLPIPSAG